METIKNGRKTDKVEVTIFRNTPAFLQTQNQIISLDKQKQKLRQHLIWIELT